jgi:glucose/arabinose dehydrogenase
MRRYLLVLPLLVSCSLLSPAATAPPTPFEAPTVAAGLEPPLPEAALPSPTPAPPAFVTTLPDPSLFAWQRIPGDFRRPVDVQDPGDGRLFVVEQRGRIRVVQGGAVLPDLFIDLTDRVGVFGNEQGLLGLALHPDFASNGLLYVNYTDLNGDTVISRFQLSADPSRADPSSERTLLQYDQPYPNHNGGGMAFGPDGYLYIGSGDGGSAGDPHGNGQRLDTFLGKLLRIDVDHGDPYAIPPDNPFPSRPEVWAYGLRNPWRFSFDPLTGDLYIGDVGQNQWEEVDFQAGGSPGGANYGWSILEGTHIYEGGATVGLTLPVAEYSHDVNCSVTGGVVVRDPSLPELEGVYLYGDYCSGLVWGLVRDPSGAWLSAVLFQTGFNISSFGKGQAGEVYLLDHNGALYRLGRAGG